MRDFLNVLLFVVIVLGTFFGTVFFPVYQEGILTVGFIFLLAFIFVTGLYYLNGMDRPKNCNCRH